jgi:tetratricopeptide (TPR) repeat protein
VAGAEDAKPQPQTEPPAPPAANAGALPIALALTSEIPKPRDWPLFQRYCVVLFQAELNDPNALEYGRPGQEQQGIDIIGKRDGDIARYVGVQCRRIVKPLKYEKILSDCRAALAIKAELKEIIFATTAPDDKNATDAAVEVEKVLAREGHTISVVVYGWEALQNKIAMHPRAHRVFHPAAFPPQEIALTEASAIIVAEQLASRINKPDAGAGVAYVSPGPTPDLAAEDPVLHARIDALAELITDGEPILAEQRLLALLNGGALNEKPAARYRVLANLGSIALDLGRESEAAERFEEAYALRPTDGRAIAYLGLARTLQGRFSEAMQLAQTALKGTPRADHAVGYLLQAAARSDWQGDPETLVPDDLKTSKHAALGLAEFWRRRDVDGWEERVVALAKEHPDVDAIRSVADVATLSLALGAADNIGMGGPVGAEDLNTAADHAKARVEAMLRAGFADQHDLAAHLNNAALLLRLADRDEECAVLLESGSAKVSGHPALARLHALTLAALGRRKDALEVLNRQGEDAENTLLGIEIRAGDGDGPGALAQALALSANADENIERMRWRIVGEVAVGVKNLQAAQAAVDGLRALDADDPLAEVAEARRLKLSGADEDAIAESLRAAAAKLNDGDLASRYVIAEAMSEADLDAEAADLLDGHVKLDRLGAVTMLYLESLASARRDVAFQQAIVTASFAVQNHPAVLRLRSAHAWNTGDLKTCHTCIDAMIAQDPVSPWARLMRMELAAREDRMSDLLKELEQPVETLPWRTNDDRMRVALLLVHMGFSERAAALAYRVFLENRDLSRAWMTLSSVVLQEGLTPGDRMWLIDTIGENAAVDISYEDGETEFFIIEPDARLRKLDTQSWEPDHPLAKAALGKKAGETIADGTGRAGKIIQVRHKYVARLHEVMEEHDKRFPTINGFQRVKIAPDQPDGLEEFKETLKAIRTYNDEQVALWKTSALPLAWLAHQLGTDEIDLASGLAGDGVKLKVALGRHDERDIATAAIKANGVKGCVLDLLAFWTAWRLKSLEAIAALCGPISVVQSSVDHLRARAEKLELHAANGALRMAGYEDGKITVSETSAELVLELADDLKGAIAWIEQHAAAKPVAIGDDIDADVRDLVRSSRSHVFDSAILAKNLGVLLISDDFPTRVTAADTMGVQSAWSDQVLRTGADVGALDYATYARWAAQLVGAGHDYVGTNGKALADALALDVRADGAVGYNFTMLAGTLGGVRAEPGSHVRVAADALFRIWRNGDLDRVREPATGLLLEHLVAARADYKEMLAALYETFRDFPPCGNTS